MKKENSIDLLIENLAKEFIQIPNFDLTQSDPIGNKVFNFVVRLVSEFHSYQNLFVQHYLPASLKSIQIFKREVKHSKYKGLFNLTEDEYKENYYETVRLGYVGAYHKYENYIKSLSLLMDEFFKELDFDNKFLPIKEYIKSEFDVDIFKSSHRFLITQKINWISNCVKHYDGFPIKEPIPEIFNYHKKTEKMKIDSKEFKSDMQFLIKHNQLMLSTFFLIGFHQFFGSEFETIKDQLKPENKEEYKIRIERQKMGLRIKLILDINNVA